MTPIKFDYEKISAEELETNRLVKEAFRPVRQFVYLIGATPFLLGLVAAFVARSQQAIEHFVTAGAVLEFIFLVLFIKSVPISCEKAVNVFKYALPNFKITLPSPQKFGFRALIHLEKELHLAAFNKPVFGLNSYTRSIVPIFYISIAFTVSVLINRVLGNNAFIGLAVIATVFNLFFTIVSDSALVRIPTLLLFSQIGTNSKAPATNYPREASALVSMPELDLEAIAPPSTVSTSPNETPNQ